MTEMTHMDDSGRPRMVDISGKADTSRLAAAGGRVEMKPETLEMIKGGGTAKGDVLVVAKLAGIMAAKQTAQMIPLCHPIQLAEVDIDFVLHEEDSSVEITARAKAVGKTGVEMEAMVAVAATALTIYDMCKAVDRGIRVQDIRLKSKSGGKSGDIVLE